MLPAVPSVIRPPAWAARRRWSRDYSSFCSTQAVGPYLEPALRHGLLDDLEGHSVLDTAARVQELGLAVDLAAGGLAQARQPDEWGVADCLRASAAWERSPRSNHMVGGIYITTPENRAVDSKPRA